MRSYVILALLLAAPLASAVPVAQLRDTLGLSWYYGVATQGSADEIDDWPALSEACRRGGWAYVQLSAFVSETTADTLRLVTPTGEALATPGAPARIPAGHDVCAWFRVEGASVGSVVVYEVALIPTPF